MCYEQPPCRWFRFNPVDGTDKCLLPKGQVCTADREDTNYVEDKGCGSALMTGYIIGVDLAKKGADYSVAKCPACKTFQKIVCKEYLCKTCTMIKRDNSLLKI